MHQIETFLNWAFFCYIRFINKLLLGKSMSDKFV